MTTRAIVPNADGEGSLGTSTAKWGAIYSSSPASGDNSGQVPTTEWVQKLVADSLAKQKTAYEQAISTAVTAAKTQAKLDAHPVGSYYWSNDSTSPATLFGGTWEALPPGYTLIAQGSGSDSFGSFTYEAGEKYGERMHKLTTDELPKITGDAQFRLLEGDSNIVANKNDDSAVSGAFQYQKQVGSKWTGSIAVSSKRTTANTDVLHMEFGSSAAHNNTSLSVAAYGWKRTA